VAEGDTVILDRAIGERAGFDFDAGGFEQRIGQRDIRAEGSEIGVNQVDEAGHMRPYAAPGADRGDQQQMCDGLDDSARAAAEGQRHETCTALFEKLVVLGFAG
jgi:hypothetical protein